MLAAYCFYTLLTRGGVGFTLAGVIAVLSIIALSLLCYRLVSEPVREHEAAVLIATIALGLIFQELMLVSYGGHFLGVPSTIDGVGRVAGVGVPYQRLLILVVAGVMLAATWVFLYHTRLRPAIRATAHHLQGAKLMGMN